MKRALPLFSLVSLLALVACGGGPKVTVASPPEASDPALARGRTVFEASCKRCHGYPDASTVSEAQWPDVMKSMGGKAGLSDEDRSAVLAYVLASRKK